MVSFVCDHCQETLKKNKLDQHKFKCRHAIFSCIDCSVTFEGTSYKNHTSCISEQEKYEKTSSSTKKIFNPKSDPIVKQIQSLVPSSESNESKKPKESKESMQSSIHQLVKSILKKKSNLSYSKLKSKLQKKMKKKDMMNDVDLDAFFSIQMNDKDQFICIIQEN